MITSQRLRNVVNNVMQKCLEMDLLQSIRQLRTSIEAVVKVRENHLDRVAESFDHVDFCD